jgi:hypothetical protein
MVPVAATAVGWTTTGCGDGEAVMVGVSDITGAAVGGTGVFDGSVTGRKEVAVGVLVMGGSAVGPTGPVVGNASGPGKAQLARKTAKRTEATRPGPSLLREKE